MSDLELIKQIEQRINRPIVEQGLGSIMKYGHSGYVLNKQKQLIGLNLNKCNLDDISFLSQFTQLQKLFLSNNDISDITALKKLKSLNALNLSNNKITEIIALNDLKNLNSLDLSNNKITKIKTLKNLKKLQIVNLSNNKIREFPTWMIDFNLEVKWSNDYQNGVYLENNPLKSPPPEIIQQGNVAIKAFFHANRKRPLNEFKILFVGDGGAGKTSLSKLLRDQTFDPHENQTHGINIDDWKVGDITAHLWDFGGQEILRATHKFFLSKRSLYVLVLDNREERDEERWLKRIESFGGNSPILIVLNKCEQNASYDVDRRDLVRRYSGLQTQDFYFVSCADKQGIAAFKKGLIAAFKRVELINSVLPESWFQVKTMLELRQWRQHYISYDQYIEICQQEEIKDTQTQDILARLLHDLGVSVHFEDLALLDTHVLEPKWITEGVYKIITSPQLTEQQGVLNLADLAEILKPRSDLPGFKNLEGLTTAEYIYPPTKYAYLLELMKKFELSYRLNDHAVLIPQLLKPEEPEFAFDDSGQMLRFQILYDYLDDSIMPRFIVALHQDIDNRIQWRKGVLLKNPNFNSQAVVRVNYQDRLLTIVVKGEQKRDYFAVIRKALQDIHASFEWKKPPIELVPLPDNPNYTVSYKQLIGYEKNNRDDYFDGELEKLYSVSELLNGIEKPEQRKQSGDIHYHRHNHYGDYNEEKKEMNREIHTGGGDYVEGDNVAGDKVAGDKVMGDKVAGDKIVGNNEELATLLAQLLNEMRQLHPQSTTEQQEINIVIENIHSIVQNGGTQDALKPWLTRVVKLGLSTDVCTTILANIKTLILP